MILKPLYFVGTPNDYMDFILLSVFFDSVLNFIYKVYSKKNLLNITELEWNIYGSKQSGVVKLGFD